jgi:hypothetical protein
VLLSCLALPRAELIGALPQTPTHSLAQLASLGAPGRCALFVRLARGRSSRPPLQQRGLRPRRGREIDGAPEHAEQAAVLRHAAQGVVVCIQTLGIASAVRHAPDASRADRAIDARRQESFRGRPCCAVPRILIAGRCDTIPANNDKGDGNDRIADASMVSGCADSAWSRGWRVRRSARRSRHKGGAHGLHRGGRRWGAGDQQARQLITRQSAGLCEWVRDGKVIAWDALMRRACRSSARGHSA